MTEPTREDTQLGQMAHRDRLTGLANRQGFQESLNAHLVHASRYGWRGALVVIDLDDLDQPGSTAGDAANDELLRSAARSMCAALRGSDVLARLGGNEFVVLLPESGHDESATVARKLVTQLAVTDEEGSQRTASVGVATIQEPMRSEQLFVIADRALYAAKRAGGNTFRIRPERETEPAPGHPNPSGEQEPAPPVLAS